MDRQAILEKQRSYLWPHHILYYTETLLHAWRLKVKAVA